MKVHLSKIASIRLAQILDYLQNRWSKKSEERFLKKFQNRLKVAIIHPEAFPETKNRMGVRKVVVTKQVSFYYIVKGDEFFVLTIFDNRMDPDLLNRELNVD